MAMARSSTYCPSPFPIGQPIVLVPERQRAAGEHEEYPSRIEDVLKEELVVSTPMLQRKIVDLPLNSAVSAYFNRSGARYHFRGTVKASNEKPFPVLHLANLGRLERQERRAHARVNAIIEPALLNVLDEDADAKEKKLGFIVNLSAGGLGLTCRRSLSAGTRLEAVLDLPMNNGRLAVTAEVVRCRELDGGYRRQWQVGARMTDISAKDRDRLTAFVLQQQQALRRRGLL